MTTLTNDGLLAVAECLRVQTFPTVLAVAPQQDSFEEWTLAQRRAVRDLRAAGLLDGYGEVDPELATALLVLAQPDREVVARVYTGAPQPIRLCLARRAGDHVLAVRDGDSFDIRTVWEDGAGSALLAPLLRALGSCPPADVAGFSAPAAELAERLDAAHSSIDFADAVYALGVPERDATAYGLAFATTRAYAEIVAQAHEDGSTIRPPGAVAVYDTERGRLVAAPGYAPDQQVWSTLTPGSDHRLAQAISGLIDMLPGERWR
ncbi:ESX secretion-associated protein EspG [Nocardia huaxiensis]|uniref:ESX secretion-associated protein EspG n=1 Tax=Nocardia huaxiensis TaxID=2755382 RepID=A0A7D6ZKK3_9NOCA|nr:ESX secretion-associated protein EspG [Nocardia huaxiensis]QLY31860.1 ESX secretion-associated protein EspG [Nocardia huaxiensis]